MQRSASLAKLTIAFDKTAGPKIETEFVLVTMSPLQSLWANVAHLNEVSSLRKV